MKPVICALALFACTSFAGAANAGENICMPASEMGAALTDWYGETRVDDQIAADAELWASLETGTWTLVEARLNDMACVIAQGNGFAAGLVPREVTLALMN